MPYPLLPEEAEEIAENWIKSAPTYSFDGFDLKLENHEILESIPEQHILTYFYKQARRLWGSDRSDRN